MRLLNVRRLEFQEFNFESVPPYVIASHTWIPGSETTFADMQDRRGIEKSGYQKVLGFANYVKEYILGIKWLWVDTCCMDQRDGAEVTKAINSMFRWYLHAAVCLAYLQDVPLSGSTAGFTGSRWFKRGWTLQELLAPQAVVFLTQDWQVIGHKADRHYQRKSPLFEVGPLLNEVIAATTGIPEAVLSDFHQSKSLSIEERLEWIDRRAMEEPATKEPEDMSYSLMGIFDVSMFTKYGEGEGKARKRLLVEISKDLALLAQLPVASGAAFDDIENETVSECLPKTRVDLLQDIDDWANSEGSTCIFWLAGMAGTGKSTIFKTIAQRFRNQHRLAASFCFKRGEADRAHALRLITTISAQLAQRLPGVRDNVISALEKEPDIIRKSLKEQFQKLILQPLKHFALPPVHGAAWVIGIDALDECDNESDICIVIDLLARLQELKSANFRLFVTSRPDLPVRLSFNRMSSQVYHNIRLEEIPENVIVHDIAVYLRHKLAEIRLNYTILNGIDSLGQDWPGEDALQSLVQIAQPLFVFAATVCRLLGEPDEDPKESLRLVLDYRVEASQLDRTYLPVLDRILLNKTKRQQEQIAEDFKVIVGTIVILAEPLPIPALAKLLEVSQEKVSIRLQRLHSILDVPSIEDRFRAVRPLHLSLRDYLTDFDTREKSVFWIDEVQTHRDLSKQCLRLLSEHQTLQEDLCAVKHPGTRRAEISRQQIDKSIRADVAYACSYWVWHLVKGGEQLCDNCQVHKFLEKHFLHWLEALSWLGRLSGAVAWIRNLQSVIKVEQGGALLAFIDDARRFMLRNRYIIDLAPLQTYSSALLFTPRQTVVRQQFKSKIPDWIWLRPQVALEWSAETHQLEGHNNKITAVAYSPDGQTIASGSDDKTVRLWDAATGEEMHKLEGHDSSVVAVVFSPDGQTVASGSWDRTVRLWNASTGEQTHKLEGHDHGVTAVAFSPDGQTVLSGSKYKTVRLWNAITGVEIHKLVGHEHLDGFTAVAFSPDRQTVAFSTHDTYIAQKSFQKTVRLCNFVTGKETHTLEGHKDVIAALAFSPDGQRVVSGSRDSTVRLWDAATGEEMHKLEGHNDVNGITNGITAVAFSPDARTIVSGSYDKTLRLWNAVTGVEMHKLENYSWPTVLTFSPDGQTLASGTVDNIVRLCSTITREKTYKLKGHDSWVRAIAFSPDGQTVASGSQDNTVRLWNALTGEETHKLEGHNHGVTAVAFSPDGQTVASGSWDTTVRLWNALTGIEICCFKDNEFVKKLFFDEYGDYLLTMTSVFDVRPFIASSQPTHRLLAAHLNLRGQWIQYHGRDVLWLPYEYRGCCSAVYENTLVVGQWLGPVSFFGIGRED